MVSLFLGAPYAQCCRFCSLLGLRIWIQDPWDPSQLHWDESSPSYSADPGWGNGKEKNEVSIPPGFIRGCSSTQHQMKGLGRVRTPGMIPGVTSVPKTWHRDPVGPLHAQSSSQLTPASSSFSGIWGIPALQSGKLQLRIKFTLTLELSPNCPWNQSCSNYPERKKDLPLSIRGMCQGAQR